MCLLILYIKDVLKKKSESISSLSMQKISNQVNLLPLDDVLDKAVKIESNKYETVFLNKAFENSKIKNSLAALFDLFLIVDYYNRITQSSWVYCPESERLVVPFLNACPICSTQNPPKFVHTPSTKPASGSIGKSTARALGLILKKKYGEEIDVFLASEPIDIILTSIKEKTAFLGEVKSAPLLTLPPTIRIYANINKHEKLNIPVGEQNIDIYIPSRSGGEYYYLCKGKDLSNKGVVLNNLSNLIQNNKFVESYITFWNEAFTAYKRKDLKSSYFWITSACGSPVPIPTNWPSRSSNSGKETISDAKTSFGLDRTDDIKKATYQALKIRRTIAPSGKFKNIKVGLVSNAYPERHTSEYINPVGNLMWILDSNDTPLKKGDTIPFENLQNIFDAIITLTTKTSRDEWCSKNLIF